MLFISLLPAAPRRGSHPTPFTPPLPLPSLIFPPITFPSLPVPSLPFPFLTYPPVSRLNGPNRLESSPFSKRNKIKRVHPIWCVRERGWGGVGQGSSPTATRVILVYPKETRGVSYRAAIIMMGLKTSLPLSESEKFTVKKMTRHFSIPIRKRHVFLVAASKLTQSVLSVQNARSSPSWLRCRVLGASKPITSDFKN